MTPNEKTAADLEWHALLDQLAERCQSRAGADRVRSLAPEATPELARSRMRRSAEAVALASRGDPIPASGLADLGDLLTRLARDAVATSAELNTLRSILRVAHTLRRYAHAHRETHAAVAAALASDPALDRLLDALDFAIDADGGLADRASPDLAHARRKANEMRQRVISRLDELIARYAEVLQDRYYTVRDGRYVLPVRSDSHIRVAGIVLGSSASGATLFIEPRAVTSLGNQLKVAMADVEREEARVLADLSDRARRHIEPLEGAWQACIEADVLAAIARLSESMDATAIELDEEPVLELRAMRHPLLALSDRPVVANDLALRSGRVLVISGPNAGGKTVALKCLGLAAVMARAGLPVPADEGSRIGWFDPVLSDVGDDQSLARSLSTFSAHVTNLARILASAGRGALVLLDELAGGTDPEEGAALAAAVLDRLAAQGAAVSVTTHYELLKTLAVRDPRIENASVGFDLATMSPTFRVTLGIPGASSALAVASRYGVPPDVIERARAMIPEQSVDREVVLRRIQDEQAAAQMARLAAETEAREAARIRTELEAERTLQRARETARISKEGQELLEALRHARGELRGAEARLRKKKPTDEDVRDAERAVDAVAAQVAMGGTLSSAVARAPATATTRRALREDEVRPGSRAYVSRLGSSVEIVDRPAKGQVRVAAGPLKLFVAIEELSADDATGVREPEPARATAPRVARSGGAPITVMRTDRNTCDVRGLRGDDAASMIDSFVDRLVSNDEPVGYVLHGHGTGALKAAVREHLRTSPFIARSAPATPDDGGDAFTVFWVKE
jgi:DNA mismatch repair protein MutS2